MANCGQACPYNTLGGCKVKEYNAICPLSNMATPITEYKMTNADRIRAMSDEELAKFLEDGFHCHRCSEWEMGEKGICDLKCEKHCLEWLKEPVED